MFYYNFVSVSHGKFHFSSTDILYMNVRKLIECLELMNFVVWQPAILLVEVCASIILFRIQKLSQAICYSSYNIYIFDVFHWVLPLSIGSKHHVSDIYVPFHQCSLLFDLARKKYLSCFSVSTQLFADDCWLSKPNSILTTLRKILAAFPNHIRSCTISRVNKMVHNFSSLLLVIVY